jgi:hypothetical protein
MALITQADVESRIGRELNDEEIYAFKIVNEAAQARVENSIGSSLEATTESTRYYDGGVRNLAIDPCTDISAVKYYDEYENVNYTFLATDIIYHPQERTLKTMLRYRHGRFDSGMSNIGVTAKFSINADTEMLRIVKDALLEVIEAEVKNSSNIKRESIEGYSVEWFTADSQAAFARVDNLFQNII